MAVTEYEFEPIRGLPGDLPEGERILWQGAPDAKAFATSALYSRWVALYFAALAMVALASGQMTGAMAIVISGLMAFGLITLFAWSVAKTTVYTITNARVVLRIGVALNKCVNLPLAKIGSAEMREMAGGYGNIALVPEGRHGLSYLMLWPHVRPLRFGSPQPMLRAVPEVAKVANVLLRACDAVVPNASDEAAARGPVPAMKEAAA